MQKNTLSVILAGGAGTRLFPLTKDRAKPAVPFGGKYRIIDFTLTNCLHSGLRRILVLTQYKSHSLNKHLRDGWSIFNPELGEYITTVPPQMRINEDWYSGTANALYQNLYLIERSGAERVIVLAGDHIYRMDYAPMIQYHNDNDADMCIACMEVGIEEASHFGVMSLDASNRVVKFAEKPKKPEPSNSNPKLALASMGIYVFKTKSLIEVLKRDHQLSSSSHDFGKDVVPYLIDKGKVLGYRFGGESGRVSPDRYWRDVGNIDSFYEANMDLLKPIPPLDLYQRDWPIRTYSGQYPPARTTPGKLGNEGISINSISSSGTIISGGSVQNSILFNNVYVGEETIIDSSILFEDVKVGEQCYISNCIIDKAVEVPSGTIIGQVPSDDAKRFHISEKGIVVIPKGYEFSE